MKGCRNLLEDEILQIGSKLSVRNRCILLLGVHTGFRIAELLSIQIGDVMTEKGEIRNVVRVRSANTKGGKEGRALPIHPTAKEALASYLSRFPGTAFEPLFRSARGGVVEYSVFWKALKKACDLAGIDSSQIGSHSLRKSFAKRFYEACGKDLYLTQQALGHSHISATVKYLQEDGELISKIIMGFK